MDRSLTALFAPDDPTLTDYQSLQKTFGGNVVAMLVYRDDELMTPSGLRRNKLISQQVAGTVGVRGVLSPSRLNEALQIIRPSLPMPGKGAASPPPLLRADDTIAQEFVSLFDGYTHSGDRTYAAIVAMLDVDHPPETIDQLRELTRDLPDSIDRAELVGEPVLLHDGFRLIERDGDRLALWTIALLSLVIVLSLRDIRYVVLTVTLIVWTNTTTRAALVLLGIQLSLVSSILLAIVTVVAVTGILHLGVRQQTHRRRGKSLLLSTTRALALLTTPILWTCATDAAGFASLSSSRILPVQQFGWMIAIAATLVALGTLLLAPLMMSVPVPQRTLFQHFSGRLSRRSRRCGHALAAQSIRYRYAMIPATAIAAAIALVGTLALETETSFLNNFRHDSEIVQAYDVVEHKLGGSGVWDVVLPAPRMLSTDYLDQVRALESNLRDIRVGNARLTKVLSLADAEAIAAQIPLLSFAPPSVRLAGMRTAMPVFCDALLTSAGSEESPQLRIMMRSNEQLSAPTKLQLIAAVQQAVASATSTEKWKEVFRNDAIDQTDAVEPVEAKVTGYYVMMSQLVSQLVGDQWRCLAVSALSVWLLLTIAARSIRQSTAAMLPNLIPALAVLALAGTLGGKMNMGAAMIAAVSIGLSIDGSVH
ncbi:MAG: MMPL family transporter, partial [Planctomycetota bacterium]